MFGNTTGAYELDLSLTNDYTKAWREMHVHSDVFCSGKLFFLALFQLEHTV